ncbi:hypothetical protein D3C81_2339750 [compost metagenome]
MADQRQQVVPNGTDNQQGRLLVPGVVHGGAKHGVDGDQQGTEGDSGVTLP